MQSAFNRTGRNAVYKSTGSVTRIDETYDLKGLNLVAPDQVMPKGESPYTINSRQYAREDNESRVSNRTRRGSTRLSAAIGEQKSVANLGNSNGNAIFSPTQVLAQQFTATSSNRMSRLDLNIKANSGARGHVIVEIRTTTAQNLPGTIIAQSSILANNVTPDYQYLPAYFMDAPQLVPGTAYYIVVYTQDNGAGSYNWSLTPGSGALQQFPAQSQSWVIVKASLTFQTYTALPGGVKGSTARYPSNKQNRILFAQNTSIFALNQADGTVTPVDSGLSPLPKFTRFAQVDDTSYWVNGQDSGRMWAGGSSMPANIPGITATPKDIFLWQNRLFLQTSDTRFDFSDLSNFGSYPSVNYFYVPTPLSPDPVVGSIIWQGDLHIFTRESHHVITGYEISSFTRKELTGAKGAVSKEAIAFDSSGIYFFSDDGQLYRSTGTTQDVVLSDKMQPEFQGIIDYSTVSVEIYRNQIRMYYAKAPSLYANRMAVYDLTTGQWFMDTGISTQGCLELYLDNNQLIEFSSVAGWAFNGETGYSDLGKRIDWKYWTPYETYGAGSAKKRIKKFRPVVRLADSDYTMSVGKDLDFANQPDMRAYVVAGTGAKWGAFKWGDGTKWGSSKLVDAPSPMSGRGRYVQYRFERNGVETPVELDGYISQYKIGAPK